MINRRSFSLVAVAALTGCATGPRPREYWTTPVPNSGYLVIGWGDAPSGWKGFYNASSYIHLRSEREGRRGTVGYSSSVIGQSGEPYKDRDGEGRVAVRYLPPGEYVLEQAEFFLYRGAASQTFSTSAPIRIQFTIAAGEATYLGRFAASSSSEAFFWMNREIVDLELARKQMPATETFSKVNRVSINNVPKTLKAIGNESIPTYSPANEP
jgi:hypothetical protein